MSKCLRNMKQATQFRVNWLLAFYKVAKRNEYTEDQAKRLAVYSVERMAQESCWLAHDQVLRIERRFPYKGKETAETFDRLIAGREATEEINLWHLEGVKVDEQIVMHPETQTIAQIEAELNAEVRRIRIERFGWPRYLRESRATVIDVRDNDIDATKESLMEINFRTETWSRDEETDKSVKITHDKARVLVCACPSTAKVFVMRVPREIESCEIAQQWLHGNRSVRIIGAS